ncbi:molecular chaperone [Salmonella enterica]
MYKKLLITLLLLPSLTRAESTKLMNLDDNSKTYSIDLGASRIIFNSESDSYNLPVENKQSYPVLVQSKIMNETSDEKSTRFIVTPPLFRLDAGQKNTVSVIKTGNIPAGNKESLNWLCVKSIPPTDGSAWVDKNSNSKNSVTVNVMVNSCIKLILRPSSLDNASTESYGTQLKWEYIKGYLSVRNPTPYVISFNMIKVNERKLTPPTYLMPGDVHTFSNIEIRGGETIRWTLINDYGAPTNEFKYRIK